MVFLANELTILCAFQGEKGILRFLVVPESYWPGVSCPLNLSLAPSLQAHTAVLRALGSLKGIDLKIQTLRALDPLQTETGQHRTILYLMKAHGTFPAAHSTWPTIADILRKLPSGRNRLVYNKAMQYFAGVDDPNLNVLEVDQEVRDRLKVLMDQAKEPGLE